MPINMSKYIGNVFLKVEDVKKGPIRATIKDVSEGRYGKPDLTFHDGTKLSLNATNGRVLAHAYGMEGDDWLGKEVELKVGEIEYRGEPQEAIRVRPISPPGENQPPPKPDICDEVPF